MNYRIKELIIEGRSNEIYVQYKLLFWWFTVRGTYGSRFTKAKFSSIENAKYYIFKKMNLFKQNYTYPPDWR